LHQWSIKVIFVNAEFMFVIVILSDFMPDALFAIKVSGFSSNGIIFSCEMITSWPDSLSVESIDLVEFLHVSFESVDG